MSLVVVACLHAAFPCRRAVFFNYSNNSVALNPWTRQVNVEDYDDIKSGYRIIFQFDDNPYFTNTEVIAIRTPHSKAE